MKRIFRHWKAILAGVMIFACGVGLGVAGSAVFMRGQFKKINDPKQLRALTDRRMNAMVEKLDLSPEQIARIRPIMDESARETRTIREKSGDQIRQLRIKMRKAIEKELTPEQKETYSQIMKERERHYSRPQNDGERPPRKWREDQKF